MKTFFRVLIVLLFLIIIGWLAISELSKPSKIDTRHEVLLEQIEEMGKLELIKYKFSDVIEHKAKAAYLPDASVLLIVKADAVGCIDLSKIVKEDITVVDDSVSIILPKAELCYVKIDHNASKVYDTKMAYFREAFLVDQAYKAAEKEITRQVKRSDILQQAESNALTVFRPILEGLGFKRINLSFH